MIGWGWQCEMGKEQWLCGHSGIEGEGWKQVGERDDWNCGIASVNKTTFSSNILPLRFCPSAARADVGELTGMTERGI